MNLLQPFARFFAELYVSGQVIKGNLDGVHDVVLKISGPGVTKQAIMKEITVLKNCRHSNIVQVRVSPTQDNYLVRAY